jgi:Ca2+-binding RTX toxin-like protein
MSRLNASIACACLIAGVLVVASPAGAKPTCEGRQATKVGTARSDEIRGTKGSDVIVGRGGADLIFGLGGDDLICGNGGGDTLSGGGGDDQIIGQKGGDLVYGDAGDDRLDSGNGNFEAVIGGPGNDSLDGGTGILDFVSFLDSAAGVSVDLSAGTAVGEGDDVVVNAEGVFGSGFNDTITGTSAPNYMTGEEGDDTITGGGGGTLGFPDLYFGNAGNDTFTGGSDGIDAAIYADASAGVVVDLAAGSATGGGGSDVLNDIDSVEATDFNDTLTGSNGDNLIVGGAGDDRIDGAAGVDAAIFFGTSAVNVDLAAGTATGQGSDNLSGIENVFGTEVADILHGDASVNLLEGGGGKDQIFGEAANDVLVGGIGTDTLDGGDGTDTCLEGEILTSCESTTPPAGYSASTTSRVSSESNTSWRLMYVDSPA